MAEALAPNIVPSALQVGLLVLAAAAVMRVSGIRSPIVRLTFWRVVLIASLALPWVQPLVPLDVTPSAPEPVSPGAPGSVVDLLYVDSASNVDQLASPSLWILTIIACGIAARGLWLSIGLLKLHRLRVHSRPAHDAVPAFPAAIGLTGATADLRLSSDVAEPVTFGARNPVVLLPERFLEFSDAEQLAIVCHELVHVKRRDWLRTVIDEVVRTVFWYHPAIWWLLDRIHLCREQVVDRLVVTAIGDRQSYLTALWQIVSNPGSGRLRPASAFLGRAHVTERVALLVREDHMSRWRVAISLAAAAMMLAGGAVVGARAFPLYGEAAMSLPSVAEPAMQAPQPPATQPGAIAPAASPNAAPPKRTKSVEALYPATAPGLNRAENVTLAVTIDAEGRVSDVRSTSGAEPFTLAAVDAARRWEFQRPARAPYVLRYQVHFPAPGEAPATVTSKLVVGGDVKPPVKIKDVRAAYPPEAQAQKITGIVVMEATIAADGTVSNVRPLRGPEQLVPAAVEAVKQWRYEPTPALAPLVMTTTISFTLSGRGMPPPPPPSAPVPGAPRAATTPAPSQERDAAIRVGGNIKPPRKIQNADPVYPPEAQENKVQGVVILEVLIGADGQVADAKVLRSVPMLDQAAIDAVMQWAYEPTLLNGAPVPVLMTVTVNFTLQ